MRKIFLIAIVALSSCTTRQVKVVIIGKDMSFDRYGSKTHTVYYKGGSRSVNGSDYYSLKIGDTMSITELRISK